jgi:hypothetical protein
MFVAPFLFLAPFLLRYGFEIRMYGLAILVAVVSTLVLLIAREKSAQRFSWWWLMYAILIAIGMWTLNLMIFVFFAQSVWIAAQEFSVNTSEKVRTKLATLFRANFIKSYAVAIILYLPWLWFAVDQLRHDVANHGALGGFSANQLVDVAREMFLFQPNFMNTVQEFLLVLAAVSIIFFGVKYWRVAPEKQRDGTKLLLFLLSVPTVIFLVWGVLSESFFTSRYFAIFSWALYVMIGIFAAQLIGQKIRQKVWIYLSVMIIFIAQIFGSINLYQVGNGGNNWQQHIEQNVRDMCDEKDTKIVVNGPQIFMEIVHYLPDCANLFFYANWSMPERGGYAPMRDSSQQIYDFLDNTVTKIIWINGDDERIVPKNYHETSREMIDWLWRIDYEKGK